MLHRCIAGQGFPCCISCPLTQSFLYPASLLNTLRCELARGGGGAGWTLLEATVPECAAAHVAPTASPEHTILPVLPRTP